MDTMDPKPLSKTVLQANASPEQLSLPREMNCSRGNSSWYRLHQTRALAAETTTASTVTRIQSVVPNDERGGIAIQVSARSAENPDFRKLGRPRVFAVVEVIDSKRKLVGSAGLEPATSCL